MNALECVARKLYYMYVTEEKKIMIHHFLSSSFLKCPKFEPFPHLLNDLIVDEQTSQSLPFLLFFVVVFVVLQVLPSVFFKVS